MSRIVAIVGRPNVGKSRLFNRLTRSRISSVHDQPGVTRDVVSADVKDGAYTLLDTGGLGLKGGDSPAELTKASEKQVDFAIEAADLILFVVDGLEGFTALDTQIADAKKKVDELASRILVETDTKKRDDLIAQAFKIIHEEAGLIPLHQQALVWGVSKKVKIHQRADNQILFYWVQMQ